MHSCQQVNSDIYFFVGVMKKGIKIGDKQKKIGGWEISELNDVLKYVKRSAKNMGVFFDQKTDPESKQILTPTLIDNWLSKGGEEVKRNLGHLHNAFMDMVSSVATNLISSTSLPSPTSEQLFALASVYASTPPNSGGNQSQERKERWLKHTISATKTGDDFEFDLDGAEGAFALLHQRMWRNWNDQYDKIDDVYKQMIQAAIQRYQKVCEKQKHIIGRTKMMKVLGKMKSRCAGNTAEQVENMQSIVRTNKGRVTHIKGKDFALVLYLVGKLKVKKLLTVPDGVNSILVVPDYRAETDYHAVKDKWSAVNVSNVIPGLVDNLQQGNKNFGDMSDDMTIADFHYQLDHYMQTVTEMTETTGLTLKKQFDVIKTTCDTLKEFKQTSMITLKEEVLDRAAHEIEKWKSVARNSSPMDATKQILGDERYLDDKSFGAARFKKICRGTTKLNSLYHDDECKDELKARKQGRGFTGIEAQIGRSFEGTLKTMTAGADAHFELCRTLNVVYNGSDLSKKQYVKIIPDIQVEKTTTTGEKIIKTISTKRPKEKHEDDKADGDGVENAPAGTDQAPEDEEEDDEEDEVIPAKRKKELIPIVRALEGYYKIHFDNIDTTGKLNHLLSVDTLLRVQALREHSIEWISNNQNKVKASTEMLRALKKMTIPAIVPVGSGEAQHFPVLDQLVQCQIVTEVENHFKNLKTEDEKRNGKKSTATSTFEKEFGKLISFFTEQLGGQEIRGSGGAGTLFNSLIIQCMWKHLHKTARRTRIVRDGVPDIDMNKLLGEHGYRWLEWQLTHCAFGMQASRQVVDVFSEEARLAEKSDPTPAFLPVFFNFDDSGCKIHKTHRISRLQYRGEGSFDCLRAIYRSRSQAQEHWNDLKGGTGGVDAKGALIGSHEDVAKAMIGNFAKAVATTKTTKKNGETKVEQNLRHGRKMRIRVRQFAFNMLNICENKENAEKTLRALLESWPTECKSESERLTEVCTQLWGETKCASKHGRGKLYSTTTLGTVLSDDDCKSVSSNGNPSETLQKFWTLLESISLFGCDPGRLLSLVSMHLDPEGFQITTSKQGNRFTIVFSVARYQTFEAEYTHNHNLRSGATLIREKKLLEIQNEDEFVSPNDDEMFKDIAERRKKLLRDINNWWESNSENLVESKRKAKKIQKECDRRFRNRIEDVRRDLLLAKRKRYVEEWLVEEGLKSDDAAKKAQDIVCQTKKRGNLEIRRCHPIAVVKQKLEHEIRGFKRRNKNEKERTKKRFDALTEKLQTNVMTLLCKGNGKGFGQLSGIPDLVKHIAMEVSVPEDMTSGRCCSCAGVCKAHHYSFSWFTKRRNRMKQCTQCEAVFDRDVMACLSMIIKPLARFVGVDWLPHSFYTRPTNWEAVRDFWRAKERETLSKKEKKAVDLDIVEEPEKDSKLPIAQEQERQQQQSNLMGKKGKRKLEDTNGNLKNSGKTKQSKKAKKGNGKQARNLNDSNTPNTSQQHSDDDDDDEDDDDDHDDDGGTGKKMKVDSGDGETPQIYASKEEIEARLRKNLRVSGRQQDRANRTGQNSFEKKKKSGKGSSNGRTTSRKPSRRGPRKRTRQTGESSVGRHQQKDGHPHKRKQDEGPKMVDRAPKMFINGDGEPTPTKAAEALLWMHQGNGNSTEPQ
eukprot:TRINITY_DN2126_c0_g1_i5.p1 TRINITY_DN2126_c0_g1~~TRINITY_DN2126_c0_g1_i5.p1  ORF type:complete len:1637 (-),score=379.61 TRINITY_DN2126_c0_g1_i5:898-5808(-)